MNVFNVVVEKTKLCKKKVLFNFMAFPEPDNEGGTLLLGVKSRADNSWSALGEIK